MTPTNVTWLPQPEEHDYPAALSFLSMIYDAKAAGALVQKLRNAPVVSFKAKDIFRASGLSLLGISNSHVEKDRRKIASGQALSPLLLVRHTATGRVLIADGYHRLCAVYSIDEDAVVSCKIT